MDRQPSTKGPPTDIVVSRDIGHKRRLSEGANNEPSTSGPQEIRTLQHKRRLDEEVHGEPSTSGPQGTRTLQPLPKRVKKEKGSIFIPKKNKVIFLLVFRVQSLITIVFTSLEDHRC
jgi:senataxin